MPSNLGEGCLNKSMPLIFSIGKGKWKLFSGYFISGYEIPEGFETDFASIPKAFWPFIGHPMKHEFQRASLLHDYLIRGEVYKRSECDRIFLNILRNDGVSKWKSFLMWFAVRYFYWVV